MSVTTAIDVPPSKAIPARIRTGSARTYSKALSLLLIAPLVLLMGFGFLFPVGKLLLGSVFTPEFGFEQFHRLVRSPVYLTVLLRTFEIALAVTLASLIIGYPIAFAMARLPRRWAALTTVCVLIPLWTSTLVRSYAWIVLLQRKGIVNELLLDLGWIGEPLRLIYTEGAVIMAMTHVLLPYTILPIYAAIRAIPNELGQAARNLGAGGASVFWRIMLPLSLPGVFAGSLMTFILALGFYVTPALVGGPRTMLMATLIGQQTTETLDWAFAGALSTVLLAATLVFVIVFRKTLSFNRGFAGVS
jgi:mannopine transport system permease protein